MDFAGIEIYRAHYIITFLFVEIAVYATAFAEIVVYRVLRFMVCGDCNSQSGHHITALSLAETAETEPTALWLLLLQRLQIRELNIVCLHLLQIFWVTEPIA
jgi:hypothetical protein